VHVGEAGLLESAMPRRDGAQNLPPGLSVARMAAAADKTAKRVREQQILNKGVGAGE